MYISKGGLHQQGLNEATFKANQGFVAPLNFKPKSGIRIIT